MQHYELLIIGGGAAGGTLAHLAAQAGRRVAMVERHKLGGTCLNYGCDPTKTLLHLASQLHDAQHAGSTGIHVGERTVDWPEVQAYLRRVVDGLRGGSDSEARAQLKERGIEVLAGEARFAGPHEVIVASATYRADTILIATGSSAVVPDIPGLRDAGFLTNREAIWLDQLPQRMAIIGGGPIGIEFAQLFHRFGVAVTVLEQGDQILPKDDVELTTELHKLLAAEGINIETGVEIVDVTRSANERRIRFTRSNGASETLVADELLVATGFQPVIAGLNLQAAGVKLNEGAIVVDEALRTSVPHIWAAGDVLGQYQFTHIASAQGRHLAEAMFSANPQPFDDRAIPWVTYTSPELAHVGKTEAELREAGTPYAVGQQKMSEVERAVVIGQPEGLVKLLVGRDGALLGGHILAAGAGEMLAPIVLALRSGLKADHLAPVILPYPTLTEAVRKAAEASRT